MPKGIYQRKPRTPKVYESAFVERVRELYPAGMTQAEIGAELESSQHVIWRLMKHHHIGSRVAAKREQGGQRNHAWRGNTVGYAALHLRVATARGKASLCDDCGTTVAKRFEWANLTGRYEDVMDYKRLCRACHSKFDGIVKNLGSHALCKAARS